MPTYKASKYPISSGPFSTKDGLLMAQLMAECVAYRCLDPCPVALSYNKEFQVTGSGDLC